MGDSNEYDKDWVIKFVDKESEKTLHREVISNIRELTDHILKRRKN